MTIALSIRWARGVAAGALLGVTAACGGGDGPPAPGSVAGRYTLRTVNNAELPYTELEYDDATGHHEFQLLGGSYQLDAEGTFSVSHTYRELDDGVVVDEGAENSSGTYTRSGNVITLRDTEGTTTATFSGGGTLTIVGEGQEGPVTLRYVR